MVALDAVIAKFLAEGPTEDELRRSATRLVSQEIGQLEVVGDFGGKGMTLAEGQLYLGNPANYKESLARIAALTPDKVRAAVAKWLARPVLAVNTVPGTRTEKGELMGGWGDEAASPAPKATAAKQPAPKLKTGPKREFPPVAPVGDLAEMRAVRLPEGHPPVRKGKVGVLLLNLGTPDGTDYKSMRRYLKEFLSDRRVVEIPALVWQPILRGIILNTRPKKSAAAYSVESSASAFWAAPCTAFASGPSVPATGVNRKPAS